ncbi:hypothetical protein ILUMI_26369 [Ignelater luminosus]|uniref:Uncharacterized protein n=1 Tax=Ignelater luminosus TaxID=2038154 RepID=A0A8K0FZ65_IGNLU|nr:hypothetical protein ILUMI_26369 [Ignelater luminosus]
MASFASVTYKGCNKTNKKLQEILKLKLTEIEGLSFQVSKLEKALQKSEQQRECEEQAAQQIVSKLTENLKEVTQKFETKLGENTREFKEKQLVLEKSYSDLLQQKEEDHELNLRAIEERLQKEISSHGRCWSVIGDWTALRFCAADGGVLAQGSPGQWRHKSGCKCWAVGRAVHQGRRASIVAGILETVIPCITKLAWRSQASVQHNWSGAVSFTLTP